MPKMNSGLDGSEATKIILLGTGTPVADLDRLGACVALVVNNTSYLVDFGPGVVRRAAAACKSGTKALHVTKLKRALARTAHVPFLAAVHYRGRERSSK